MTARQDQRLGDVRRDYRVGLLRSLSRRNEDARSAGYDLGRQALEGRVSMLDLVRIHHDVLAGGTAFAAPIESVQTTGCDVVTLDLGPLYLDVLGLVIELAPVNLDVTAVPGAGNLLGTLVCPVAGLLDGNIPLGGLAGLLNRLLTGLGL